MKATRIVELALEIGRCDQRALFNGAARVVHLDGTTRGLIAYVEVLGSPYLAADGPADFSETELTFRFVKSNDPVYDEWAYAGTVSDKTGSLHIFCKSRAIRYVTVDDAEPPQYIPV